MFGLIGKMNAGCLSYILANEPADANATTPVGGVGLLPH